MPKETNTALSLLKRSINKRLKWLFFLSLLAHSYSIGAQQDTAFWFAAPDVSLSQGESPIHLRLLSYSTPATVTISQPANVAFVPIIVNLGANSNDSVDLTPFISSIESPIANVPSNNGLKISSTANITAYYELSAAGNKEIFSLKGSKGLGTEFYTPFQNNWDNSVVAPATFSSIDIVASEDNTTVLITPRTNIVGHTGGVTYSVLLQKGETYSARDIDVTAATTLAGSIVASDKPIAVTLFSGALSNLGCSSTMGDQISTSQFAGQDFIIHKGKASGDRVYILATQNATFIDIDNSTNTNTLINWSESYEYVLTDTINYIHTSKPVYVWHVSGYGCNLSGAQVPNLFCAGKYNQAFARSSSDSLGLLLYTRTGFEGMFQVNGNSSVVTASDFTVVPGTSGDFMVGLVYMSLADVPLNTYNEVTNSGDVFGMAVLAGENGQGSSYAYLSEFNSYPFVDAGIDDTICANVPFNITGIVGGGSVTGTWGGTGFGTFSLDSDSLINTYIPSALDTIVSPISLILTSTGPCPVNRDTLILVVEPGPIVNASADQTVCANNAVVALSGTVTGGAITGTWTTLGSGSFSPNANTLNADYIPSTSDSTAGAVTLVLTSTNIGSCLAETDTMVITITNAPFVDAGPDTISVCSNNPNLALSGLVTGATSTGKWTTSGNGVFNPDNVTLITSYEPSPTDVIGGLITLYLESTSNGSCNSAMDSIKVFFSPSPIVNAGANIIACTNEPSFNLSGAVSGPTSTGIWTGGFGLFAPNDSSLTATYIPSASEISSGSVLLTLTSTNNGNCASETDEVQIDFVAPPFANFNFTEVCLGGTHDFTDFSLPGFGTIIGWDWDFGDGMGDTIQNTSHDYGTAGFVDVQLIVTTDVGCSDTTVKAVEVYELPTANFTFTASCVGSNVVVDFVDSSYTANDIINYWFYDFGGQGTQAVQDPAQLFVGDGDFVVTQIVQTENGCADTVIHMVTIPPSPVAGFYYNTSNGLNIGAEFSFIDTSSNAVAWDWTFGNGGTSTDQDPSTIYFANGTYVITQYAYGALGCVDSTSTTVVINTVTTEINTLIPNAISPNGDGKNDVWKLDFIDLLNPQADVKVFNRWGQTLFESVGYQIPWDGTYNDEPVPEGTYYYVIVISDSEVYKGSILVLTARK
ncbi:MAG: gliding motility-associated C-terminal domain-containing protein [Flavobacteriales bacterium]|nr:gliding motility-associated C-terminal domain-containing protein [Flavobacteriales bacterium]